MAKYLIHSCNQRQWYVDKYLIPNLISQGIERENIQIFQDTEQLGNLFAFIRSLEDLKEDTWHLQDDIILSTTFKKRTEEYDEGIVCGFCSTYTRNFGPGIRKPRELWCSFPCIRIPNKIAHEFVDWFYKDVIHNPEYRMWVRRKKYDDSLFRIFLEDNYTDMDILNLAPNIVNHIDYLLGGSVVNNERTENRVTSIYWEEQGLLEYWEGRLVR